MTNRVSGNTAVETAPSVANNTSTTILSETDNRRQGTFVQNNTAFDFWATHGAGAAVVGSGFRIPANGLYAVHCRNALKVIQNSGSAQTLHVVEVLG